MVYVKKYGVLALCALALIALFLPMATVEVGSHYSKSLSGFTVAFQGYVCMLLIVGPITIAAADYIAVVKRLKALIQVAVAVIGIILTFVGYLQASDIAAAADAAGMGYVECEASFGFGGILCILAYVGIGAITLLFQKDELTENIKALKGAKSA